jgi:hypothetical protein
MTNETLSLLGAAAGGIFGAGVAWATMRQRLNKTAADVNGLGAKLRAIESRAERRWKHMIATQIETSADLDEAKLHAKLLREDAWRD